jgi:exopolysaccharide biosynthesis protein
MEIPDGGFVVSASGEAAPKLAQATPGLAATAMLGTTPDIPHLRHALGAGPQLVRNGQYEVTAQDEQFRADVRLRACPRTAVGVLADGNILIAAGECEAGNALTLSELAGIMVKLGCRDAMALDGGGSTTVVARGRVLNRPTDGGERAVADALVVVMPPD